MAASERNLARLAGKVLNEVTKLLRTELKLFRAEIFEKLTFTALSIALLAAGAFLLLATLILLLQAGVAGLVDYGFSWSVAFLIVAGLTLLIGATLVWLGVNGLGAQQLAPSKTINQLQKDASIVQRSEP